MAKIILKHNSLSDGRKLEFCYSMESYYSGKWHKARGERRFPDFLPFDTKFHESYDRKIYRVRSWDAIRVLDWRQSWPGSFAVDLVEVERVKVCTDNVQRLHELLTDAGRADLIPVLLRYLGEAAPVQGGVKYAL